MKKDKYYVERRARAVLGVVTSYDISNLVCSDRPDLQDSAHSVGIEVVQDCYENERHSEDILLKLVKIPYNQIPLKGMQRFKELGTTLKVVDNQIVSATLGPSTLNNPEHLLQTIHKKVRLLNSGEYKIFFSNRLYVDVDTMTCIEPSHLTMIVDTFSSLDSKYKYDTIYIDHWYELFICDLKRKEFSKREITPRMRANIEDIALCDNNKNGHQGL